MLALPILITEIPQLASTYFSLVGVLELGYILLFGSWLPIYLLYIGSEHLTPTHTALYRYIQPVIATTMAVIRGQTIIDRTNIVGAVLIFVGMLCVIRFSPRTTTPTRV